jgi:hypothetical protein
MASELERVDTVAQDIDLYGRMTGYFDQIDQHFTNGVGWVVFNAGGQRGRRIASHMLDGYQRSEIPMSLQHIPWRDFSLNAYMVQVELHSIEESGELLAGRAKEEFDIATRVSREALVKMVATDVLILSGVRPKHRHEVDLLDKTIERRMSLRSPTVFITPMLPHEIAVDITRIAPDERYWDRIFERLYRHCLLAM